MFRRKNFRGGPAAASEPKWVHTSGGTLIRVALFTDLLIFLADVGLGQRVGDLCQVRCQQRSGAAVQHGGQHHERDPGVGGRGRGGQVVQQQLEEDGGRHKRAQQLRRRQALGG